jgi:hypothetical protein
MSWVALISITRGLFSISSSQLLLTLFLLFHLPSLTFEMEDYDNFTFSSSSSSSFPEFSD